MRMILACFLLALPLTVQAAEISCYSGKARIYHGWGTDFIYNDQFLGFIEDKTNRHLLISADCIIDAPRRFEN